MHFQLYDTSLLHPKITSNESKNQARKLRFKHMCYIVYNISENNIVESGET